MRIHRIIISNSQVVKIVHVRHDEQEERKMSNSADLPAADVIRLSQTAATAISETKLGNEYVKKYQLGASRLVCVLHDSHYLFITIGDVLNSFCVACTLPDQRRRRHLTLFMTATRRHSDSPALLPTEAGLLPSTSTTRDRVVPPRPALASISILHRHSRSMGSVPTAPASATSSSSPSSRAPSSGAAARGRTPAGHVSEAVEPGRSSSRRQQDEVSSATGLGTRATRIFAAMRRTNSFKKQGRGVGLSVCAFSTPTTLSLRHVPHATHTDKHAGARHVLYA